MAEKYYEKETFMLVTSLQDDRDNRLYDLRTMVDTHITIRVNCALKSRTKERK